jgi:hypothetical protein
LSQSAKDNEKADLAFPDALSEKDHATLAANHKKKQKISMTGARNRGGN